jgi:hypothetical protein
VTTITIKRDVLGDFLIFFQSREREAFALLVSSIKGLIEPGFRDYRPAQKCWAVDSYAKSSLDEWLKYVQSEIPAVKVVWVGASEAKEERQRQHQWPPAGYRKQPTREELCARLHLLPDAPAEVVKAAYKALAQLNHPDKGGDEEAMKLLNEAYAKLAA